MAVKLQMNVPQTFELSFPEGAPVTSRFGGDQVMFSLTNGEKWFTEPFIAQQIKQAGIGAYMPFTVCKREVVTGNRRRVEYDVQRIEEQAAAAPIAARAVESPTTSAVFVGAGASPTAAAPPSSVAVMKVAGIAAIDAVLEIEKYAQSRGMVDFNFGADNIQKITACLFIEMSKKAGRA